MREIFLAAYTLLQIWFVPGAELVGPHMTHVESENPLLRSGQQYSGYAEWWYDSDGRYRESISIDTTRYPEEYIACLLTHEAAHLTFKYNSVRGAEEIPYLYEYVCLDRLNAPQWLKDDRYRQMSQRREVE